MDTLGGPEYFNHFPWGWTWAGNTPFRRWKRETYRGGISDPFIVHYPNGIQAKGEVRTQYTHAIDMVPTVLDVLGFLLLGIFLLLMTERAYSGWWNSFENSSVSKNLSYTGGTPYPL